MVAAIPCLIAFPDLVVPAYDESNNPHERPEYMVAMEFLQQNDGNRLCWAYFWARAACLVFPLLGGWVCWRWTTQLYGGGAAVLVLLLWVTCPMILGWGATVYTDVPAASMGVLASYCFWKWTCKQTRVSMAFAGVALGAALLTKLIWILMPLIFLIIHIILQVKRWNSSGTNDEWKSANAQLLFLFAIAVLTVNLFYGFDRSLKPLGVIAFRSELFTGKRLLELQRGNRFNKSILGNLPVPFPEHFVLGLDTQRRDFEEQKWSYLRGEYKLGGWYYYYVYAGLVKLPICTLLLLALAAAYTIVQYFRGPRSFDEMHLLMPAIAVLVLVSSQIGFNWYVRYAIPSLPFLYIWTGRLAQGLHSTARWSQISLVMLFFLAAAESVSVFPHSISFFNLAIGGPKNGPKHLLYGAIDVGQDALLLKKWIDSHPEANPIHIKFSGVMKPSHLGIESLEVPPHKFDSKEKFIPPKG